MWWIYLVYNGNKKQVADKISYEKEENWRYTIETMPFDIVDEDDHNCWVDFGDL